jgi:4-amino-4-deoxy-L-arabinose transferase-like glycosyltransferase
MRKKSEAKSIHRDSLRETFHESIDERQKHNRFLPVFLKEVQQEKLSLCFLLIIIIACLIPFCNKAFHIDDPVYIWIAKHILVHPIDFYGFSINWDILEKPVYEMTQNPPLVSYYIALASLPFGFGEIPLHIAFLIPALAASLGTYYLAREISTHPLIATLASLLTPAFLVSSSTIMVDVPMLAFWVWSVVLWFWGIKNDKLWMLYLSAILAGLSFLSKYYGICLVPLLFCFTLAEKRSMGWWVFPLLIPIAMMGMYDLMTYSLYGHHLVLEVFLYPKQYRGSMVSGLSARVFTGLSFMGGGFIIALLCTPLLWSRRMLLMGVFAFFITFAILSATPFIGRFPLMGEDGRRWMIIFQLSLFIISGLVIMILAFNDLYSQRDSKSLLLFLWLLGTFLFSTFINWTINIRTMLPMAPVIGILIVRQFIRYQECNPKLKFIHFTVPLVMSLVISLLVVEADYSLANTARNAAYQINEKYGDYRDHLQFAGHWGFQYYMQEFGFKIADLKDGMIYPGDIMAIPYNNTDTGPFVGFLERNEVQPLELIKLKPFNWLSSSNCYVGAGFYWDAMGPLPYVFGAVPDEHYAIIKFQGVRNNAQK